MALDAILAAKRRRLAAAPPAPRPFAARSGPGLAAALARPWPAFILECKAASPSAGVLLGDYDPAALAAGYGAVADALSVLTEPDFFGGDISHLSRARAVTALPLLRKDFLLVPEEVREARAVGADAVLLMLSVLDDEGWRACAVEAANLGMDVLTEVHDERELARALALGAPLVGINNRDLATLAVDLAVTERLAPRVPSGTRIVSESGIASRADVARLAPLVDGFLVGTSLARNARPEVAARELVYGRVKVCGLTRGEDARAAWNAGAVMGGLIFAPDSPRRVDLAAARRVRAAAPLAWVGVFRDQSPYEVAAAAKALALSAVQLHGAEDAAVVGSLRERLPEGCEIWKAVPASLPLPDAAGTGADRLLLDTARQGRLGGSGVAFDARALSGADLRATVLAGGVQAENVVAAAALGPWAIDVNSGVERGPGIKDAARLARLFAALRRSPGRRFLDG